MCEIYGFCGSTPCNLNAYTDEFWLHSRIHKDGFGYYLVDNKDYYVNPNTAMSYLDKLNKKQFKSKLALCHIRFKTHGEATRNNCHPFIKYDHHGIEWSLIHNGFIDDNPLTEALGTIQTGETDSERILLCLVEAVNSLYEHSWISSYQEFLEYLYIQLNAIITELAALGKTNLIFTDSGTNNMYVYMNHPGSLVYLEKEDGIHFSTTKLSDEEWKPIKPFTLHVFNSGKLVRLLV